MLEFLPPYLLLYLAVGAGAGLLAGLFGVGGGLIIVPALVIAFTSQGVDQAIIMHLALGTSLATICATAISSVIAHHRRGAVDWPLLMKLLPGIALGAVAGAAIADYTSREILQFIFGIGALLIALWMLFGGVRESSAQRIPGAIGMGIAGAVIGSISALCGIGGGTLTVPFLASRGVIMTRAVATSSACGLPIAAFGATSYAFFGSDAANLPSAAIGFIYIPAAVGIIAMSVLTAPLGARLAHRLPTKTMKRLFALLLIAVALSMLIS